VFEWYVITGGPSSGKTSMVDQLRQRGYRTTIEHATLHRPETYRRAFGVRDPFPTARVPASSARDV